MHDIDNINSEFESYEYEYEDAEAPFEEMEADAFYDQPDEMELAYELLNVADEDELEYFLGNVLKTVIPAAAKFARSDTGKALGGILKSAVKSAAPIVGGALGSLIPIPGVGTAAGAALGKAVGNALEMELEGLAPDDQELEAARRMVRIAKDAAQQAASAPKTANPAATAKNALLNAVKRHAPMAVNNAVAAMRQADRPGKFARSGRWIKRGPDIILTGVWQ